MFHSALSPGKHFLNILFETFGNLSFKTSRQKAIYFCKFEPWKQVMYKHAIKI